MCVAFSRFARRQCDARLTCLCVAQYRDFLHPDVLPGSYIWGEIILYECVSVPL